MKSRCAKWAAMILQVNQYPRFPADDSLSLSLSSALSILLWFLFLELGASLTSESSMSISEISFMAPWFGLPSFMVDSFSTVSRVLNAWSYSWFLRRLVLFLRCLRSSVFLCSSVFSDLLSKVLLDLALFFGCGMSLCSISLLVWVVSIGSF